MSCAAALLMFGLQMKLMQVQPVLDLGKESAPAAHEHKKKKHPKAFLLEQRWHISWFVASAVIP
jgi:hypothetical protein